MTKRISVQSTDPDKPRIELTLKGEIIVDVDTRPSSVSFGEVLLGEKPTKTFEMEVRDPEKIKVKSITCDNMLFSIKEIKKVDDKKSIVEVAFAGSKKIERIGAKLTIEIEGSQPPTITLPIRANIVGNLRFPRHLFLPNRDGKFTPKTVTIQSRNDATAFNVTKATDPDGNLKIDINRKSKNETVLTLTMKDPEKTLPANLKGKVLLKTTDPTSPKIEIQYTATSRRGMSNINPRMRKNKQQRNLAPLQKHLQENQPK